MQFAWEAATDKPVKIGGPAFDDLQDFPETMRRLTDDAVKEDLANALKVEAVGHKDTPICATIIKAVGGRIIHENRHDE